VSEPMTASVPPDEAADMLDSVELSREAAERRAGAYWFAPVVVGVLLWFSAYFLSIWDGAGVAVYWLAVAPVAYVVIKRYERIQLRLSGAVSRSPSWFHLLTGSFIAGCAVCGAIGGAIGEPDVVGYGPLLTLVAACAVSAWRDRTRERLVWTVVLAVFTVIVVVFADSVEYPARFFAVAIGANLVVTGFTERNRRGA
jgi:hypothetical protein